MYINAQSEWLNQLSVSNSLLFFCCFFYTNSIMYYILISSVFVAYDVIISLQCVRL